MSDQRTRRFLPAVLSAWLSFLVLDFYVHAIVLASWWRATESYWLSPITMFRMIPLSYAAFAIYCVGLVGLQLRLIGPQPGIVQSLRLGAIVGMAYGCSSALATYSVFPMPISALLVWPAAFLIESVGAAIASCVVIAANRPWRGALVIFLLALLLFALGIALQNIIFNTPTNKVGFP